MSIYEFDEEREMEMIRQGERAEGEQFGREQAVLSLCRKFGCSHEESIQRLMEECSLTREEAEKRVEEYRSED